MMKILSLLLCASACFGAGNVRQSVSKLGETGNWVIAFNWTGDSASGTVPVTNAQLGGCCAGYLFNVVSVAPGTPNPTSGYSVQIQDSQSVDVLAAAAASNSATVAASYAAATSAPPVTSFSLVISGQNIASATGTVLVYLQKPGSVNLQALVHGIPPSPLSGSFGQLYTALGATSAFRTGPILNAALYNFAPQTPGGTLSAGVSKTVTLNPVPQGVNGTDSNHWLYIPSCSGGAQKVLITGGTAISGATTGTITFTPINSCIAGWTFTSGSAGIQEAIQAAQTAGAGTIVAGGTTALNVTSPIYIAGNNITLQLFGAGVNLAGETIFLSGNFNAVLGTGSTALTPTTTSGDAIQLNGCASCAIAGLYVDRTATPAVSGAGINIASGLNANLKVSSFSSRHNYRGVWAQVPPVVSAWHDIEIEHNVTQGIQFDGDNDEHFTNVVSDYNGGHALQIGNGASSNQCIGGFRVTNLVTFANVGDGVHIEGAVAGPCVYVFLSNVHADTDGGYELYAKNAGAISIGNSQFVNGKGVWLGDGVGGVYASGVKINGSSQEGLMITNGANTIVGSGIAVGDSSLGNAGISYGVRINNSASKVNIAGLDVGQPNTTAAGGILVEVGTGAPSAVHLTSTQLLSTGNMSAPITIALGLTDVFIDSTNTYQTLTLVNGWTVADTPQCRLEENGNVVRIRGTITAGTTADGTTIFTLPVGLRPSQAVALPVVLLGGGGTPTGTGTIAINSSGVSSIYGVGANSFIRLHGISFSVN
jgi:hypothetical protein